MSSTGSIIIMYIWLRKSPTRRSEEHTSELQSRLHLVCRLLLEKKKPHRRDDRSCIVEQDRQVPQQVAAAEALGSERQSTTARPHLTERVKSDIVSSL